MDRYLILKHLTKVERRIAEGDLNIACQRSVIAKLEGSEQNSGAAHRLLQTLEISQAALIATRDGIRAKLADDDPEPS